MAKENNCYIAYSAHRYVPEDKELPYRNSTQLINRKGEIEGIYDKNHLVPFGEYIPFRKYLPAWIRPIANNVADFATSEKLKNI